MRVARRSVLGLGFMGALAAYTPEAFAGSECKPATVVDGVDLNADGDSLTWSTAAGAGVKFAIVKATQGNYYTDPDFTTSWAAMKSAGIVRGAYHFLDPTVSGVTQAKYFLAEMGPLDANDLPPTLDAECPTSNTEPDSDGCLYTGFSGDATGAQITQAINDWVTTVKAATGRQPIIYSYGSWFSDVGVTTTGYEAYPLWIADYSGTSCFTVPAPWTTAAIWQYTDAVTYAGIGSQDGDYFLGSLAQLTAFASTTLDGGTTPPKGDGGSTTTADATIPEGPFTPPAQVNGNDAFSLVNWADGHIELYTMGTMGTGYRIDTALTGTAPLDTWAAPVALGGPASCGIASVYWAPGSGKESEVFDGLANGTTERLEYEASSSSWMSFVSLGGVGLSHLSTVAYPDSHVEVFALGDDGHIWHNVSTHVSWDGWATLGSTPADFATGAGPILWNDGHAQVFATDKSGAVWQNATNTASPPAWAGWQAITGATLASRPIPARWTDGHVQVFAHGTDNHLYTSDSSGGAFAPFTALNPTQEIQGEPSVLVYAGYGPEIFARDMMNDVIHMWNGTADAGPATATWSTWANDFGQVIASDPMAWTRPDGLGEVFGIDGTGNVVKSLHSGGDWSTWATIGTGASACVGGTTLVDAGTPVVNAEGGLVTKDSGLVAMDSGIVTGAHDARAPEDSTVVSRSEPDGGGVGTSSAGGCSCRVGTETGGGGKGLGLAGMVLGLGMVGRRRRRLG